MSGSFEKTPCARAHGEKFLYPEETGSDSTLPVTPAGGENPNAPNRQEF
jgi:hypothetical protein